MLFTGDCLLFSKSILDFLLAELLLFSFPSFSGELLFDKFCGELCLEDRVMILVGEFALETGLIELVRASAIILCARSLS